MTDTLREKALKELAANLKGVARLAKVPTATIEHKGGVAILELLDEIDRLRDALTEIDNWSRAYPLKVFPEPDFAKVRELLEAGGITLDAVSASNMRHVVEGVGKIASHALRSTP